MANIILLELMTEEFVTITIALSYAAQRKRQESTQADPDEASTMLEQANEWEAAQRELFKQNTELQP